MNERLPSRFQEVQHLLHGATNFCPQKLIATFSLIFRFFPHPQSTSYHFPFFGNKKPPQQTAQPL